MAAHYFVTAENLDDVREYVALDQRLELEPGCETWSIQYEGGQCGWMTAWPHLGRGAVMHGGDSVWGDWDAETRTLHTDDADESGARIVYDQNGERVPADPALDV